MRNIIAGAFLTLDGVMQGPGGPTEDVTGGFDEGGWVFKVWDEGAGAAIGRLFAGEYDLLLGRRTYDIFAAYWPYVEGDPLPGAPNRRLPLPSVSASRRPGLRSATEHELTRG